ncbi:unnamed protein product [Phytomonas sp. Hart1]|nr:unnamed protein product [Phytomonas sp. Hart1]|eukprot:CCW71238.1 unnamed protein product [Phytomonas sp. isolate Hart1]
MRYFEVDFVLVRGPPEINGRFRLRVPGDSTPVIIGRGLHCAAVLDPWLVFASQVQCSLFCISPPVPTEAYKDDDKEKTLSMPSTVSLPDSRQTLPLPSLYILDMCSSNGTFVNNTRIGNIEPVLLKDGDSCIFGGMRDVLVGEVLPPNAFDGPELCTWRVNILNGKDGVTERVYQPTPTLYPTPERLECEEREVVETVLRTLQGKPAIMTASDMLTPGQVLTCPSGSVAITPLATVSQRLFNNPNPQQQVWSGQTDPSDWDDNQMKESKFHPCKIFVGAAVDFDENIERLLINHEEKDMTVFGKEGEAALPAPSFLSKRVEQVMEDIHNEHNEGSSPRSETVASRLTTEYNAGRDGSMSLIESHASSCSTGLLTKAINTRFSPASMISQVVHRPATAYLRAVRLGRHIFRVQEEKFLDATAAETIDNISALDSNKKSENNNCSSSAKELEARNTKTATRWCKQSSSRVSNLTPDKTTKKKRLDHNDLSEVATPRPPQLSSVSPSPFMLQFTETHWKWCMDNPNNFYEPSMNNKIRANDSPSVFQCILPVNSVGAIYACSERMGIAVQLKEGCQVPLIRSEVLSGGPEYRYIVWTLHRLVMTSSSQEVNDTIKSKGIKAHKLKRHKKGKDRRTQKEVLSSSLNLEKEEIKDVDFETWLEQLEAFYNPYKVPPLHMLDALTFDKFLSTPIH